MAQKINVTLVDDIDGSNAAESVVFGLDGTTYEIDLSRSNAKALRKALAPYVDKGRKVRGKTVSRTTNGRSKVNGKVKPAHHGGVEPKLVRAWAAENGVEVSKNGRVPTRVVEQYREAVGA